MDQKYEKIETDDSKSNQRVNNIKISENKNVETLSRKRLCYHTIGSIIWTLILTIFTTALLRYVYFVLDGNYESFLRERNDQIIEKIYNHNYKKIECTTNNTVEYPQCVDIDHDYKISMTGYCSKDLITYCYQYQNKSRIDYKIGYYKKRQYGEEAKDPTILQVITIECNGSLEQFYDCSKDIKTERIWCESDSICYYNKDLSKARLYFYIAIFICLPVLICFIGCICSCVSSCFFCRDAIWYNNYLIKKQNENMKDQSNDNIEMEQIDHSL
ncbi:MAG: hypothetical protein Edafosvirus4_16 [Edafosvirus sp.]|uniref:Uncharacterized protein n=1 Tax=Edafosvirus sp. TaxID=2487765 RepID=A0A3G4ZSZ0_9VIRU|nr:MAG: hypothetical protein Edafosvirus4_16 [Edafosvirus sp.]